jgi:hypothetical protein
LNTLGNPPFLGQTSANATKLVGFLSSKYNASSLRTYNLAVSGSTLNNQIPKAIPCHSSFKSTALSCPDTVPLGARNFLLLNFLPLEKTWQPVLEDVAEHLRANFKFDIGIYNERIWYAGKDLKAKFVDANVFVFDINHSLPKPLMIRALSLLRVQF